MPDIPQDVAGAVEAFKTMKPAIGMKFEGDGALTVLEVDPNLSADKSGIQVGDIITSVNGIVLREKGDLFEALADMQPGDSIPLVVERGNSPQNMTLLVGAQGYNDDEVRRIRALLPSDGSATRDYAATRDEEADSEEAYKQLCELKPLFGMGFRAHDDGHGLVITSVTEKQPTHLAGIIVGDVMQVVNMVPVRKQEDFFAAIQGVRAGESISVVVMREGRAYTQNLVVGARDMSPDDVQALRRRARAETRRANEKDQEREMKRRLAKQVEERTGQRPARLDMSGVQTLTAGDRLTVYTDNGGTALSKSEKFIWYEMAGDVRDSHFYWCEPPPAQRNIVDNQALPLKAVTDIYVGKTANLFQRAPGAKESLCVSIVSAKGALNFEMRSKKQLDAWLAGIGQVLELLGRTVVKEKYKRKKKSSKKQHEGGESSSGSGGANNAQPAATVESKLVRVLVSTALGIGSVHFTLKCPVDSTVTEFKETVLAKVRSKILKSGAGVDSALGGFSASEVALARADPGERGGSKVEVLRDFSLVLNAFSEDEQRDMMLQGDLFLVPESASRHSHDDLEKYLGRHGAAGRRQRKASEEYAGAWSTVKQDKRHYRNPKALMEGNMQKQGGAFNTSHQQRYFVLLPDQLQYYRYKSDVAARGVLPIGYQTLVQKSDQPRVFHITAHPGKKKYTLTCENDEVRGLWLSILRKCVDDAREERKRKLSHPAVQAMSKGQQWQYYDLSTTYRAHVYWALKPGDSQLGSFYWHRAGTEPSPKDGSLPLAYVTDIFVGKQTAPFKQARARHAPEVCCLTMVITKTNKMLNIEAPDEKQLNFWLEGIKHLLKRGGRNVNDELDKQKERKAREEAEQKERNERRRLAEQQQQELEERERAADEQLRIEAEKRERELEERGADRALLNSTPWKKRTVVPTDIDNDVAWGSNYTPSGIDSLGAGGSRPRRRIQVAGESYASTPWQPLTMDSDDDDEDDTVAPVEDEDSGAGGPQHVKFPPAADWGKDLPVHIEACQTALAPKLGSDAVRDPKFAKRLKRPPFKFLAEVVTGLGGLEDVWGPEQSAASDKAARVQALQRLVSFAGLCCGHPLQVDARKVAAGMEVASTLHLLQALALAADLSAEARAQHIASLQAGATPEQHQQVKAKQQQPKEAKQKELQQPQEQSKAEEPASGNGWTPPSSLPTFSAGTELATCVKATQEALKPFYSDAEVEAMRKPLSRPPYKFLVKVVQAVDTKTGFFEGVFEEQHLSAKSKVDRVAFFERLLSCLASSAGQALPCHAKKVAAGLEPERTNHAIQILAALASHFKASPGASNAAWCNGAAGGSSNSSSSSSSSSKQAAAPGTEATPSQQQDQALQQQEQVQASESASGGAVTAAPAEGLSVEEAVALSRNELRPYLGSEVDEAKFGKKLSRPPLKFIAYVLQAINKKGGLLTGVVADGDWEPTDKKARVAMLQRLIRYSSLVAGLKFQLDPRKVAAGRDPAHTNHWLQQLAKLGGSASPDKRKAALAELE